MLLNVLTLTGTLAKVNKSYSMFHTDKTQILIDYIEFRRHVMYLLTVVFLFFLMTLNLCVAVFIQKGNRQVTSLSCSYRMSRWSPVLLVHSKPLQDIQTHRAGPQPGEQRHRHPQTLAASWTGRHQRGQLFTGQYSHHVSQPGRNNAV